MDGMRAADADRERVAAALREEMAVGRLTMEEFEERISNVYAAKTWDELRAQTSDLPVDITFDGEVRQPRPAAPAPGPMAQDGPPLDQRHGGPPAFRGLRFSPFLLIPLVALGIGVAHGAFGALIPMAIIFWIILGSGVRHARRRGGYHYRTR